MKTRAVLFAVGLMLSGAALNALPAQAQLFGESDKEKAARLAHEDEQDSNISQLGTRVQQLEDKVRNLVESLSTATGANEQLTHQIQELRQEIADQQKDFAYRLCMISAQQLGAGPDDQGLNCGTARAGAASASAATPGLPPNYQPGQPLPPLDSGNQGSASVPSDGAPQPLGRPPGTLGTLPMDGSAQVASARPAPASTASQFDTAMNLLAKAQYAEASAAFRAYADANPDDQDLSAQAIYWIGDIAYVQHDYPTATRAFAEQIKKFPGSSRSPDSMLKLGQSLIAQGQTSGGCTALAEVKIKYPKASESTLAAAAGRTKPPAVEALDKDFDRAMAGMPWPGAVALSGGGDSLALMHLLAGWARTRRAKPPVMLIVDHGLRRGSAAAAKKAASFARKAGLEAHILTRVGRAPKSDIEAIAREARYRLMGAWMRTKKIGALYVGHTLDDQAETFLLRLGRGSGLDGLSAMRPLAAFPLAGFADLALARPLLEFSRDAVRAYLGHLGHAWLEDPMNSEERFARSRIRALMPALEGAGLSAQRIADAAAHLSRARAALELATEAVLKRAVRPDGDRVLLDAKALAAAPREMGLRALAALLMAVSGDPYRPRFEALERLFDRIASGTLGGGATLHGCRLQPAPRSAQVFGPNTLILVAEISRKAAKTP